MSTSTTVGYGIAILDTHIQLTSLHCEKAPHLDTISIILSFEHDLANGLDPFITTGDGVCRKSDRLLVCPQADVLLVHRFAANRIPEVDDTMREIWILTSSVSVVYTLCRHANLTDAD